MRNGWKALGMFSLEKKRSRRDMIAASKYLKHCDAEDGSDLVSVTSEDKFGMNEWRLQSSRYQPEHQEKLLNGCLKR